MKYISHTKNEITFEYQGTKKTRKLNSNKEFRFNKKRYFFFTYFCLGYGSTYKIYEITKDLLELEDHYLNYWDGWIDVDLFIDRMVEKYKHLETNSRSVPSAPNTSIFTATVGGNINPLSSPDTYGRSQYSCGTYFHKAIQIGGNVEGTEELLKTIRYILPKMAKRLKYSNSDKTITYSEHWGTNFSTYGIG